MVTLQKSFCQRRQQCGTSRAAAQFKSLQCPLVRNYHYTLSFFWHLRRNLRLSQPYPSLPPPLHPHVCSSFPGSKKIHIFTELPLSLGVVSGFKRRKKAEKKSHLAWLRANGFRVAGLHSSTERNNHWAAAHWHHCRTDWSPEGGAGLR